jgi:crotonobetainyl-CoA:carnitine CoA-transferase CaiB-like acyl-CoA transferase
MGALDGIRVIDFGHYVAGPLAAVMLADQGADVIHVDPPGAPAWQQPADAFYSRGKRRITLDLKTDAAREIARRLVEGADVVIENFRPGVMERLGLGAEEMTARNPRLVYCSMPGFANDDPRAGMQAWEGIVNAATHNCIPRAGEEPPEWDWSRPFHMAPPLASNFAAFLGATGIVMALIARERCGLGQVVEVPLFDAMFTLIGHSGAFINAQGLRPPRGIHLRGSGAFRCGDGKYVQFDTSSARHLTWFAHEAGIMDWGDLIDVNCLKDEAVNRQLHSRLRELFLTKTAAEWERIGNRAGAAMGWARSAQEWLQDEHARAIEAVTQLEDLVLGPTHMAGAPVRLTGSPGKIGGPRHTPDVDRETILKELAAPPTPEGVGYATAEGAGSAATGEAGSATGDASVLQHPLQGMQVIDTCVALAGPTCGRLLYEFGADVVKINAPKAGVGGYLNRGKRSLLLDLESYDAQAVFWKLVEGADVFVENFSPGTADRLGVGYADARARRPDIIYTSVSCYGYGGPMTHARGWERQGQAVAGIMERLDPPAVLGPYNLVDIGTGTLATFATALAIFHKLRTGEGQHAQASLCQTATYHQTPYMLDYAGHVDQAPRTYSALGTGPLNRYYKAADGWFFLAVPEQDKDRFWTVEGLRDLAPGQGTGDKGQSSMGESLEARFETETVETWVGRVRDGGLSAQAVVHVKDLMVDPYVKARGLSVTQDVEGVSETTAPGPSVRLSRTPMRIGHPRQPGGDAEAILAELGMADELERLERAWVLQAHDLPKAWS